MDIEPSRDRIGAVRRRVEGLIQSVAMHPGQAEELLARALAGLQQAVNALQGAETELDEAGEPQPSCTADRMCVETAALESDGWPVEVIDRAPFVTVIVDQELRIVLANRAAEEFGDQPNGRMRGTLAGNALRCLNALADPRGCGFGPSCGKCKVRQTVLDTHATGEARRQVQARLPLRRDGNEALVDLLISTVPLEYPGRRMVLVWLEDVTRVVQNEASLRTFLEALPESAFVMSSDGTVIEANTEVASRLGILRDDLLGANIYQYVSEDVRDVRRRQVESVLQSGGPARFKDWRKGRHIDNIIAPVLDPGGEVKCLAILGLDITDHEQTKAGLRESEEKFRSFVENANDIIYTLALDGTFTYMSSNVSTQLGFEPCELLGRHYTDLVHPEDTPACDAFFQQVITTGKSAGGVTYRLRSKNGRWLWHTSNASGLTDGEGNVVSYLGISRDITEQKRQEALLLESEARYRQLVELAQEGIWALDASGRTTFANPRMAQMLGYTVAEMEGRAFYEFMDEPRIAAAQDCFRDRQAGVSEHHEFEFRRSDGSILYANLATAPLQDAGGRFVGAFAVISDITERKQLELELKRTLEATTDGIWTWDFTTDELSFSPRYYTMLGYEPGEFPAGFESWRDLMHPDDRDRALDVAEEYLRNKADAYENEFRLRTRSGEYRWIRAKARVVERASDGSAVRMIGNHEDVSERKRAEMAASEREALLSAVGAMAKVGGWELDAQTLEVSWTDQTYRIHEVPIGEKPSLEKALDFFHPEDRERLTQAIRRALDNGEPYDMEMRFITAKGRELWTRTICKPEIVNGCTVKIRGTFQDITNLKQAVGALRESEERLRLANRATNDVIWDWDIVHDSQMWNPAGATVFGWSDITRHPQTAAWWTERVHPDDHQRVADGFYAVVHDPSQVQWRDEYRFRKSDGSYATVLDRGYVMRDEQGRAVRMIGAMLDITDRKRMEEQLREALLWQETAIAAGNVGFWDWDLQTDTVVYSREWKRQIGYEEHEIGNGFEEWQTRVHPDDLEATLRIVREGVAEARPSWEVQYRFRHKDGSYRWILAQASVLCDDTGRAIRALGAHVDITKRKRAEEARHAAERDKALILDTTKELFARYDCDLRILWANKAAGASVGLAPEDLVGRHCYELWGQRDEPCRGCPVLRSMQTGRPEEAEQVIPDGRVWHLRGYPVYGDDGRVIGAVELSHDITERKRAEERLRESKIRYRTVADFTYDWETWLGRDGRLLYCSPSVKRITGYSVEELLNDPALIGRMVHPDDRAAAEDHMHQERSEQLGFLSLVYRLVTKNGEERWISHHCAPVYDDNGQYAGRRGSTRDITDRKQLEDQLRQSQKLEAVGQLAGGVAHDFNNLLTAIHGYCDMLKAAVTESAEANNALEGIREAAHQAVGVTRSLLTFSAKLPSHKQRVDLQELVRKSVHVLGRMLPDSIDIVREPAGPTPIRLYADGVQLQQILMNLTINARDAMPDGGTVRIAVEELSNQEAQVSRLKQADEDSPPAARFARLTVSDTGTGMPPEILSRIFEPLFTTKERGRGTGLGLAIVHGIVQEHQGHIEVDSAPGEGTTFTITLPVLECEQPDAVEKRVANEACARGELVLLAEDNWNIRSLVATVLRDAGFEVCEVSDGAALMARFAELADRVSLFVLDVDLPRRSGLDCLREIRAVAADTPAIVITGGAALMNADELDRYTVLIRKPFSMGELKQQAAKLVCDRSRKEAGT